MKLLFDENLAPRLATAVSDMYPDSAHVRDCGLLGAADEEVWRYAVTNGFAIVFERLRFCRQKHLAWHRR